VAAAMRPFSVTVSNSIEQTIFISPLSVTKLFIDNRLAQEQAVAMQQVYRERKCADTTGTVLVPMLKYNYIFQIKYPEAILQTALGNCAGLNLAKC